MFRCLVLVALLLVEKGQGFGRGRDDYGDARFKRHLSPQDPKSECYDSTGKPQRCIPPFENAAFNVLIEATNTCGQDEQPTSFCKQTAGIRKKSCDVCREGDHPAKYLTDHDNDENATWWQSETMYEAVQYPNQVNLTLDFEKTFDITYVRVLFESPRPESWGIYKRKSANSSWEPYQFYSATCRDTYGLPDSKETTKGDDTRVLCTSEYSDIVPLSKGTVAFSTLEGRPSAYYFENNPALQEWVQARGLRLTLDRLNTFGDEVFGDEQVLRTYYYAIADVAVGARCACNGHASECVNSTSIDGRIRRVCRCEHNTAGPDCNECLPFYNDAPWGRATTTDAHECKPCNCNGYSSRCYFDEDLYKATGHGGHCLDCLDNRDGANCERCRENYYQRPEDQYCVACQCNEIGSRSLQCNAEGKCQCKPGVTGDKCDRCAMNFFDFGTFGCTSCDCNEAGSIGNEPRCDAVDGTCLCKENVEGKRCRVCRPGYFNLALNNEFGCTPCFCYGHASLCQAAQGYSKVSIESSFVRGTERWSASVGRSVLPVQYDGMSQSLYVTAPDRESVYFLAPERFLGDQRASYNQDLTFTLRISDGGAAATAKDIVIEGGNGEEIIQPIFGQQQRLPGPQAQEYKFRLHEHPDYGWLPQLGSRSFISILSNITAIKIRGTYSSQGKGYLDDVRLETAHRGAAGEPADWIEHCSCPQGYVGQFCEACAPGYHHDPPNGGPFAHCVPCNCNGHADICEAETGQCICQHNTAGGNCQHCSRGYYGHPLKGTAEDCQPCPCPENGPCILLGTDPEPVCSECPTGRTGPRCETCSDGFFGSPERGIPCRSCECNNNIDLNAIHNCHQETGVCLKCVNNTAGAHCEECLAGYYGDALSELREESCRPCQCYRLGTQENELDGSIEPCDQYSGHCFCKPHVVGRNCDRCEEGYYHIRSTKGCLPCNCDLEGSYNRTCDPITGQCHCKPGVVGQRCDYCQLHHYGFGRQGCKPCDCDKIGSVDLQCDQDGQCPCLPNVEGRTCDRCKENKFNRQYGCVDCPACYNIVQEKVDEHREKLAELEENLKKIKNNPTVINEESFKVKLQVVQDRVNQLYEKAKQGSGMEGNKSLVDQLLDLRGDLVEVNETLRKVDAMAAEATRETSETETCVVEVENVLDKIHDQLSEAEDYLATDGQNALNEAKKPSQQVGEQNQQMTAIAEEARTIADANMDGAKRLVQVAEQAKNTTQEAYNMAKATMIKYQNISEEIRDLESKTDELEEKYGELKKLTATATRQADAVSQEALNLLVKDVSLPNVNATDLKKQIDNINTQAAKLKQQANTLLEDNINLIEEIEKKMKSTEETVSRATDQEAETEKWNEEVKKANKLVTDSENRALETLAEAKETLAKLDVFDGMVQEARVKATEALKNLDDIKRMIDEIEADTQEIHQVLEHSEQNALSAKNLTTQAVESAKNASSTVNAIREEGKKLKNEVIKIANEAEKLQLRLSYTDTLMTEHEQEVRQASNETTLLKERIGQTKSNMTAISNQVAKALNDIAEITKELESLPDIDNVELDRLEEKLRQAEADLVEADLDNRIRSLTEAKNIQTQMVKNYEDEISKLRIEVDSINEVRKTLPSQCFKRITLEPQ